MPKDNFMESATCAICHSHFHRMEGSNQAVCNGCINDGSAENLGYTAQGIKKSAEDMNFITNKQCPNCKQNALEQIRLESYFDKSPLILQCLSCGQRVTKELTIADLQRSWAKPKRKKINGGN